MKTKKSNTNNRKMKPFVNQPHKLILGLILGSLLSTSAPLYAAESYHNMFISYYSPNDVKAMADYANALNLGGYILWEARGDTNPVADRDSSLLYALSQKKSTNAFVMGYWTDWSVYNSGHAQSIVTYTIPGSQDNKSSVQVNSDLSDKLNLMNALVYSFLEAQSMDNNLSQEQIGSLYFFDPWADLTSDDNFCVGDNSICNFVPAKRGNSFSGSSKMGNFEAFAKLKDTYPTLKTVFSVGGYSHESTFESIFTPNGEINSTYADNFVNSALKIMQYYHMDGIDLDYENPYMSKAQSRSFLKLVQKLDSKLTANQFITVTILSNPQYITGSETAEQIGFDNQVLKEISTLSHVKLINLMTYDFHGAFDYQSDGSGKTGFLTNLYMPNNAPDGYDPRFSVQTAVEAMQSAGVPNSKIGIGIPAYGRSLANIDKGSAEAEGLFQPITNAALVPGGDLDSAGCDETITHADNTKPVCTGTFTYGYITSKMLSNGFLAKDWQNDSGNQYNGTTAYATSWSPAGTSYNHKLEIKNTGNGIGFQVSIAHDSNQFSSDWLNPGVDKVYDTSTNPDTTTIEGIDHLSVSASTWNKTYTCAQTFDFNKDYQVILKVDAAGNFSCELQPA